MLVKSPVAEVRVLPKPGNSAAKGNLMSVSRVHDDADALVWPRMCCCCCRATDLDAIGIYSRAKFGNIHALIHIPYCRRCKLHYRRASGKALESAAEVFGIGLAILSVAFFAGILIDSIVAFILQLLLLIGAVAWAGRTFFVARAEIEKGITPECSVARTPAVIFLTAQPSGWRFRFFSRAYAEQFAAVNPGGSLETLCLD
jgi:hypothetical protein